MSYTNRLPVGTAYLRMMYRQYRNNAKLKKRDFHLTFELYKEIVRKNCHYCGDIPRVRTPKVSPAPIPVNGIDRVRQDEGYVLSNVVPCCPTCNTMKWNLSKRDFLLHIKKINDYLFPKPR